MAREAEQLARKAYRLQQVVVGRIQAGFSNVGFGYIAVTLTPDQARQPSGNVLLEAHGFADFADGHAGAVVNDRAANRGSFARVALVEILNYFFAPLVFEI